MPSKCLLQLRKRAFTLIELLVVIAIILVLIAILVPSLRLARQQAQRVVCASNLRSLGIAWEHYLEESEGYYPRYLNVSLIYGGIQGAGPGYGGETMPLPKPLNRYVGMPLVTDVDGEVYHCPSDKGDYLRRPTAFEYIGTSYAANLYLIGPTSYYANFRTNPCALVIYNFDKQLLPFRRDAIWMPSEVVVKGDFGWQMSDTIWSSQFDGHAWPLWHGGDLHFNLLFADGHVQYTRMQPGLYVTDDYRTFPLRESQEASLGCQVALEN